MPSISPINSFFSSSISLTPHLPRWGGVFSSDHTPTAQVVTGVRPGEGSARTCTAGQSHVAHPLSLDRQIQTSDRPNLRIWRSEVSKVGQQARRRYSAPPNAIALTCTGRGVAVEFSGNNTSSFGGHNRDRWHSQNHAAQAVDQEHCHLCPTRL